MPKRMWTVTFLLPCVLITFGCDSSPTAREPTDDNSPRLEAVALAAVEQQLLSFPIKVTDANGQPVEGAVLKPWAVRSSQGHGGWNKESIDGPEPQRVTTDADGMAAIAYPKYRNVNEQVTVTAVTVSIDHPDHPHVSHEDVKVPPSENDPHIASLPRGAAIEVSVTQDGKPINAKGIHVMSTGLRVFYGGTGATIQDDGNVRIPPLVEGPNQFMLIRIDEGKATHFSDIQSVDVVASPEPTRRNVKIKPALPIRGKLSDNVPRPVQNGRVQLTSISDANSLNPVEWFDWAPVAADGTFVIDEWPQDKPVQLIALCDGFIASNGKAPSVVPPERAKGAGLRAQIFMKPQASEITVEMKPTIRCRFECKNAFDKPLVDIVVNAYPNIRWWNSGSQVYCNSLADPIDVLLTGKYEPSASAKAIPRPFSGTTDAAGVVEFDLPAGHTSFHADNKRYQLAARGGRRSRIIYVGREKPVVEQLVLQPIGLDCLGDWEDLCGLVFG